MEYYISENEQKRMLKIHNLFTHILKNLGTKKLELLYEFVDELKEYYSDSQTRETLMSYSFMDMKNILKEELTKKNSLFHLILEAQKNYAPREVLDEFLKNHHYPYNELKNKLTNNTKG